MRQISGQDLNLIIRTLGTVIASTMLLAIALAAAATVSQERERQTLDSLLTIPLDRDGILFAKWLGSILSVRWLWCGLGPILGAGLVGWGPVAPGRASAPARLGGVRGVLRQPGAMVLHDQPDLDAGHAADAHHSASPQRRWLAGGHPGRRFAVVLAAPGPGPGMHPFPGQWFDAAHAAASAVLTRGLPG